MDKQERQRRLFAIEYLRYFGNNTPTYGQINEMESLLISVCLKQNTPHSKKLTSREWDCLYLAAQGKSIHETAQFLQLSIDTVKAYRKNILRKLCCKNMPHAVSLGVHRNYFNKY